MSFLTAFDMVLMLFSGLPVSSFATDDENVSGGTNTPVTEPIVTEAPVTEPPVTETTVTEAAEDTEEPPENAANNALIADNNGIMALSGDSDFSYSDNGDGTVTITEYIGSGGAVDIPETIDGEKVTAIGQHAFVSCSNVTSVTIPNSVTSIGVQAFLYCYGLKSITIPNSVTSIESSAFAYCTGLETVKIPDSITAIKSSLFVGCKSLTSVKIPAGITSLGIQAFYDCYSLESIELPNGVTSIGTAAFANCIGLKSITIPDSVNSVGSGVFMCCRSLDTVIAPEGLDISGCFTYNEGVSSIVKYKIENGQVKIIDIILGDGKTTVTIPDTLFDMNVVEVAEGVRDLVDKTGHTHDSTASCLNRVVCKICGE